jgi:sporulation protein YlmC with PRC-barrel domain
MTRSVLDIKRSALAGSVAACFCFGLTGPLLAADPPASGAMNPSAKGQNVATAQPAEKCLGDLQAFDSQMDKDGYWRGGSGYAYGYPVGGFAYGYGYAGNGDLSATGYRNARPGYEVRMLIASANILARHGQEQACEGTLVTTRDIYKTYVADMKSGKLPTADMPHRRQQEIAAAQPVADSKASFRSDQLIGTDVRNSKDEALGSVDDIVTSPQTGKIAYLIIARGGIFGIDEKYVPVPWQDFKSTSTVNLLVLETSKSAMEAAPRVKSDQFATAGHFDQQSQAVDVYWKSHMSSKGGDSKKTHN